MVQGQGHSAQDFRRQLCTREDSGSHRQSASSDVTFLGHSTAPMEHSPSSSGCILLQDERQKASPSPSLPLLSTNIWCSNDSFVNLYLQLETFFPRKNTVNAGLISTWSTKPHQPLMCLRWRKDRIFQLHLTSLQDTVSKRDCGLRYRSSRPHPHALPLRLDLGDSGFLVPTVSSPEHQLVTTLREDMPPSRASPRVEVRSQAQLDGGRNGLVPAVWTP